MIWFIYIKVMWRYDHKLELDHFLIIIKYLFLLADLIILNSKIWRYFVQIRATCLLNDV